MKLYEDLKWRGLIKDEVPELKEKLNNEKLTFYIGTDPSGDSLHIGHYSTFSIAKRLANFGHKPIILVGGSTGLIGDPKPSAERPIISKTTVLENFESLKIQLQTIYNYEVVNNYDWSKDINFIDYLRDYGKHFSINYMLSKDTVKSRLQTGITYTEFSYMIMQSLDYLELYKNKNCTLQVGGADQWGNITAGIDLIRKVTGQKVYGFTMPLITTEDGQKIGKSEGNAVWLDKTKTTPYEMYQYLINIQETIVIEYLKKLTFLTKDKILDLDQTNKENPHKREAQKALAREIITDLHGEEEYNTAVKISESLFNNDLKSLSKEELIQAFKNIPNFNIEKDINIVDFLKEYNITQSKREARELILSGAILLNGNIITDDEVIITKKTTLHNNVIIRKGKKNYFIGKY